MAGKLQQASEARQEANAPATVSPKEHLRKLLDQNRGAVGASLPSGYSQDRFVRLLLTAANTNPDLFACDPRSFLAAGVGAAQLGLEPNDARGLAYLVPFNDRKRGTKVVQLIIGYKGMLDLARRSGMVSSISAFPVYRQDAFTYRLGLEPSLEHVPGDHDENPDDLTHVYAVAKVAGDPQFVVMTRRQVDRVMNQSSGARSGKSPWTTHYVEMALKTALRRLCKWLPQTVEMAQADEHDGATLHLGDIGLIPDPTDEVTADPHPEAIETGENGVVDTDTGEILDQPAEPGDGQPDESKTRKRSTSRRSKPRTEPDPDQADAEWVAEATAPADTDNEPGESDDR